MTTRYVFDAVINQHRLGTRIITGDNYSSQYQELFDKRINELIDESLLWVVNDVAFTFLLRLPESGRIITTMWNRSWGIGAFKTLSGICCQKMQSIWQDWQDFFTIWEKRGGGHFPLHCRNGRELAIWYGNEYMRLSNPLSWQHCSKRDYATHSRGAWTFQLDKSYCIEKGIPVWKNDILQRGPNRFRKKD